MQGERRPLKPFFKGCFPRCFDQWDRVRSVHGGSLRFFSLLLICAALQLSGCIFVPFLESMKEIGATVSHRQGKLTKDLKNFHEALYWGNFQTAASYLDSKVTNPEETLAVDRKTERLVDMKVEHVKYSEDAFEADVVVVVRAYNNKTLVVNERRENEQWLYSMTNGWKLLSRKLETSS
jgi:hypothetical protein